MPPKDADGKICSIYGNLWVAHLMKNIFNAGVPKVETEPKRTMSQPLTWSKKYRPNRSGLASN